MPYPYVLLSAAVSLDGYLDDTGPERLLLSGPADFDRVDEVRASADAILVGAGTIRADNPRLLVNSPERRAARRAAGKPEYPLKVAVSGSGDLDPDANFWHTGGEKVVFTTAEGARRLAGRPVAADVVALGDTLDWPALLRHLHDQRGVRRLMVEGGGTVHTQLLLDGLADELQLVLAPLLVGDPSAPPSLRPRPLSVRTPAPGRDPARRGRRPHALRAHRPPAPAPSPRPPTATGWPWRANWRRGARRRVRRSASARWWWRRTAPNSPGAIPGRAATRSCTPRRRRSRRLAPRTPGCPAPRCTPAWNRAPAEPPGPGRARGWSSTPGWAGS
ncbi:hypothetical protein GCM10020295_44740 [Streptomyces cinereospinus]